MHKKAFSAFFILSGIFFYWRLFTMDYWSVLFKNHHVFYILLSIFDKHEHFTLSSLLASLLSPCYHLSGVTLRSVSRKYFLRAACARGSPAPGDNRRTRRGAKKPRTKNRPFSSDYELRKSLSVCVLAVSQLSLSNLSSVSHLSLSSLSAISQQSLSCLSAISQLSPNCL